MQISELKIGQTARIMALTGDQTDYKKKLISMGFIPGTDFTVTRIAPLGDPIEILIRGSQVSLRKKEASILQVVSFSIKTGLPRPAKNAGLAMTASAGMVGRRLAIPSSQTIRLALVGNPNCGKSTLFNVLTGANQRIGNWPGVTVERKSGSFHSGQTAVEVIDLPGIYSLDAMSDECALDERVARDYILEREADVLVNVVDACQLERHLYLTMQLLEMGLPVILALNMMDRARAKQIKIDLAALSAKLGCPVVALEAKYSRGLGELKEVIINASPPQSSPTRQRQADHRFHCIQDLLSHCVVKPSQPKITWTERIDRIVLNRWFGIPIFFAVMYGLFCIAITVGSYLQTYFDLVSQAIFVGGLSQVLSINHAPQWLTILLAYGMGKGINTVVTLVPVIGLMFLCLTALEDSGYMARAAFVVDRLMTKLGLPGKALVPMIVGFGCNVPAVMAARTLPYQRDRMLTILMAPFMSCSARLSIFAVFCAAFFPHGGQNVIFALYLTGAAMAVLTGFLLRKTVLRGEPAPLIMELPAYQVPHLATLLLHAWQRLKGFVLRAGKLIVPMCAFVSVLNFFEVGGMTVLSRLGQWLTPLFAPIGIHAQNWPATVGLLTGVLAKEVVIGTLNTLYSQWGELSQQFDGRLGAFAYLLFVLLYFPCVSTLGVMLREMPKRWAFFSALWMLSVAYGSAVIFYQSGTWLQHPLSSSLWIGGTVGILGTLVGLMRLGAPVFPNFALVSQCKTTCGRGCKC